VTTGSSQDRQLMPKEQVLDDKITVAAGGGTHEA
jgi:hypothetical protein